jgi:hypothetical protein
MALVSENGHLAAHRIPTGETLELEADQACHARMLDVKWGRELVTVFNIDLKTRGQFAGPSRVAIPVSDHSLNAVA